MACLTKGKNLVPKCDGPHTEFTDAESRARNYVFCPTCKSVRTDFSAKTKKLAQRNTERVQFIKSLTEQEGLTGTSMQRRVTARTEQVIIETFNEACSGRAPADFALMACGSMARNEMVAFSDIDAVLVLSNDDARTLEYFQGVVLTMDRRLNMAGGYESGFQFCPGGLSPKVFCNVTEALIEQATDPKAGDHVRGALFTRLVYGNEIWAKEYQKACEKALKDGGRTKAAAIENIKKVFRDKARDYPEIKRDDLAANLKSSIYRPVHMIMNELALYYGVPSSNTREQIIGLIEKKKMTLKTANFFMQVLEDYAKVMTAYQLKQSQEIHMVRIRENRKTDVWDGFANANPAQLPLLSNAHVQAVIESAKRVHLLWAMTEEWVREKEKRFPCRRSNPFKSKDPIADFGTLRLAT
jgi:signal-transduction protein with cAMP-binding, CBS, and nucleotidyltransferase domain